MWKTLLCISIFMSSLNAQAEPDLSTCKSGKEVVDDCFTIKGALSANNGAPTFRIYVKPSRHKLGLSGRGQLSGEQPIIPANLNEILKKHMNDMLDRGMIICGEFEVCPFTKLVEGSMQSVCVEKADALVVAKDEKGCFKK